MWKIIINKYKSLGGCGGGGGEVGEGGKDNMKTTLGQNVAEWPGKDSDGTKRCQIMANHLEG